MKFQSRKNLALAIAVITPALILMFQPQENCAARWITPIYQVLSNTQSGTGAAVAHVWNTMMTIINSFVLALLIYVSFMNILRIQMDSYAVKKFLPTFIMAIILANFSFLIARIIIDLANMLMGFFLVGDPANRITGAFDSIAGETPLSPDAMPEGRWYIGYIIVYLIKQTFAQIVAVLIFILALTFLIRNYVIYFLVSIAPLAFLAMVLPISKKYFQSWWSNFTKWVFMPVISVFWLWLAGQFLGTANNPDFNNHWILQTTFAAFCLYMAITTPFKVGGAVVGAWNNLGKQLWSRSGGLIQKEINSGINRRINRSKMALTNRFMETRLGQRYERYMARQNYLDRQQQDIRRASQDDAIRDVYAREYMRHITTPRGTLGRAQLSRVNSVNRRNIRDAMERFAYTPPEEISNWLLAHGFINQENELLRSDSEVLQSNPNISEEDFINGKAAVAVLARQTRQEGFREDAEPIWDRMFVNNNFRRGAEAADIAASPVPDGHGSGRLGQRQEQPDSGGAVSAIRRSGQPTPNDGSKPPPLYDAKGNPIRSESQPPNTPDATDRSNEELLNWLHELVNIIRNLKQPSGGNSPLADEEREERFAQLLLRQISNMRPNPNLDGAGLAAMILPKLNINIESISPQVHEKFGQIARQMMTSLNRKTSGIEAQNRSILQHISAIYKYGSQRNLLAQGREAIEESEKK